MSAHAADQAVVTQEGLGRLHPSFWCGHRIGLYPLVQAVLAHADPGRYIGHPVASFRDLFDRFDLEFFGIWLLCYGTSYWASGLRLGGV